MYFLDLPEFYRWDLLCAGAAFYLLKENKYLNSPFIRRVPTFQFDVAEKTLFFNFYNIELLNVSYTLTLTRTLHIFSFIVVRI